MIGKFFYKNIKTTAFILSLFYLLTACSIQPRISQQIDLKQEYSNAITDAEVVEPLEISKDLIAIVPWDTNLVWKDNAENKRLLVVTWTSWNGYDEKIGQTMELSREIWVTAAPELKNFCKKQKLKKEKITLRLEQLLGLPPGNGKTKFVEMWVSPNDLFRPSPDPEISDHEAELDFPASNLFLTVDENYISWFNNLKENSYEDNGYPWTRLGYTYDWGNPSNEIGLSEFVIRKGATVEIHSVTMTLDYCQWN